MTFDDDACMHACMREVWEKGLLHAAARDFGFW